MKTVRYRCGAEQHCTGQHRSIGACLLSPAALQELLGDAKTILTHIGQVFEPLLQAEVSQVDRVNFVTQEQPKFPVLLHEQVFALGAKDLVAMLDSFQHAGKLALEPLADAGAEDPGYLAGSDPIAPYIKEIVNCLWLGFN